MVFNTESTFAACPRPGTARRSKPGPSRRRRAFTAPRACSLCLPTALCVPDDTVMTTAELLSVVQSVPLATARSSSPKAVVSECSPIKKRRIDGFHNIDYKHRRGSRSGDLALLRVLSAPPPSPLSLSSSDISRSRGLLTVKSRSTRTETKLYLVDKCLSLPQPPTHAVVGSASPLSTIELRKEHFVFTKPLKVTGRNKGQKAMDSSLATASKVDDIGTDTTHTAVGKPASAILRMAEEVAGATAVHFKQFVPPKNEDTVARFFNPESTVASDIGRAEHVAGQLASPVAEDASLRERIAALPHDRSLLLVYPTQKGSSMFVNDMLMPVLDPLIRRTVNGHGLPVATAAEIRNTCRESLACMMDFDELRETCRHLVAAANSASAASGRDDAFELAFARCATAKVPAAAWKNAWIRQEREMIRDAVEQGLKLRGGGASVDYSGIGHPKTGVRVAEELLADLKNHRFEHWERLEHDEIEVGVFVIRRH